MNNILTLKSQVTLFEILLVNKHNTIFIFPNFYQNNNFSSLYRHEKTGISQGHKTSLA